MANYDGKIWALYRRRKVSGSGVLRFAIRLVHLNKHDLN